MEQASQSIVVLWLWIVKHFPSLIFSITFPTIENVWKSYSLRYSKSKAADVFNAGSTATLATAKALTASVTGTAAAQKITVGTNDKVKVAKFDDLSVSVS